MNNLNFNKKQLSLCMLVVLVALALVLTSSCGVFSLNKPTGDGGDQTGGDTTAESSEDTETGYEKYEPDYDSYLPSYLGHLTGRKYSGGACKIVMWNDNIIHGDDNTSTVLSKEFEERNMAVEDELDISIVSEKKQADTMYSELRAAVQSGTYYADIIVVPQSQVGNYGLGGVTVNLQSIPEFDIEEDYFYSSSISAATGGSTVYGIAGYASITPDALSGIYFNKSMANATGLGSIYDLVDSGKWTIDKYLQYMTAASALDATYYPYGAQNAAPYLTDLFYFSLGGNLTVSQLNTHPVVTLTGEGVNARLAKVTSAVMTEKRVAALESVNTFSNGKAMFLVDNLSTMKSIANSSTDWGLAPLPKMDEAQKTYNSLAYYGEALYFCVPRNAPDYTLVGDVIAALNIYSFGYTRDKYIEEASYYYLRDNQSVRMMSLIMENPVYDFAYTFADSADSIPNATFMAIRNNVMGISSVERYMDIWLDDFTRDVRNKFEIK